TGVLTYTPAGNANGSATITLVIKDDGGTANGETGSSDSQTLTITVNRVHDAPSFIKGANQTVNEDAGAQTVDPWASAISKGPADESSQVFHSEIANHPDPHSFPVRRSSDLTGVLTYTPAGNANGSATITLVIKDDGGTANG